MGEHTLEVFEDSHPVTGMRFHGRCSCGDWSMDAEAPKLIEEAHVGHSALHSTVMSTGPGSGGRTAFQVRCRDCYWSHYGYNYFEADRAARGHRYGR